MTTKKIYLIAAIVLVVLIAVGLGLAALRAYINATREPACDPATSYTGFCMNIEKDYAGATATIEAQK